MNGYNYANWRHYPWKEEFDASAFEERFDDDGIYGVEWGIDKYGSYIDDTVDDEDDNSFNGNWNSLVESSSGEDRGTLRRYRSYIETARLLAESVAPFPEVRRIVLFGDLARPPYREPNLKQPEQRGPFHRPSDLDVAVWLSSTENLPHIRRLRAKIIADRHSKRTKLSEERIRIHIFDVETSEYLGRLCTQGRCPSDNPSCQIEGCGTPPFIKPFSELSLDPAAFDERNCQVLFVRNGDSKKSCSR